MGSRVKQGSKPVSRKPQIYNITNLSNIMQIYSPEEDSYLLSESIKKELLKLKSKNIKLIEIGVGSGIQLETALKSGIKNENILGVDINNDAVYLCKEKGFNVINSNLFIKIPKTQRFDIIIFNPPYLPSHKFDKKPDTSGGVLGHETILKFLSRAKNYLEKNGFILLLTSSLTPMKKINEKLKEFKVENINEKKLFQETLYVWKIHLKKN